MSEEQITGQVCPHDGLWWEPISDELVTVCCEGCDLHLVRRRCGANIKRDGSRCMVQPVNANGFCEVHGPNRRRCRAIRKDGLRCEAASLRKYGGLCRSHFKVENAKVNPVKLSARAAASRSRRIRIVHAVAEAGPEGLTVRALRKLVTGGNQRIGIDAYTLAAQNVLAEHYEGLSVIFTLGAGAQPFLLSFGE
jgi:hypothetical protein